VVVGNQHLKLPSRPSLRPQVGQELGQVGCLVAGGNEDGKI
jgi:hypothetical protein